MIAASDGSADCTHSQTHVELMPPGHMHFARVVCVGCGKQLYWKASPGNAERRRENAIKLQTLLGNSRLSDWERGYCQGLQHNPRLSHKQQALLNELAAKYLSKQKIYYDTPRQRNGASPHECAAKNKRHTGYALA